MPQILVSCPRCGSINRSKPRLRASTRCMGCDRPLPRRRRQSARRVEMVLLLLLLGAAGTVLALTLQEAATVVPRGPDAHAATRVVHGIETRLEPVPIRTGFIRTAGREAVSPFEVQAPADGSVYVKLVHRPSNATWVTIFVEAGKRFYGEVPLGEYELRWAMGQTWYGLHELFGPDTIYRRATEPLRFERSGNEFAGHTIVLAPAVGGNLISAPLRPEAF